MRKPAALHSAARAAIASLNCFAGSAGALLHLTSAVQGGRSTAHATAGSLGEVLNGGASNSRGAGILGSLLSGFL